MNSPKGQKRKTSSGAKLQHSRFCCWKPFENNPSEFWRSSWAEKQNVGGGWGGGGTWWVLSPVYNWKCDKRSSGSRRHINNWVAALRGDWHGSTVCISGTQLDADVTGRGHKSGPRKDSICLGLPATSPALGGGGHTLSCSCPTCCMCNLLSMT